MTVKTTLLASFVGLSLMAASNAATLIGPGAGITDASDQDTPGGERLNADSTTFVTLGAGTYQVDDWSLNVIAHAEGGTVTPMLLSGTSGNYITEWIGSAFDPTFDGVQTTVESGTFTLAASTDIYAGFFTSGGGAGIIALDANNSGSGSSITNHDANGFTAPAIAGDPVNGFSHTLGRTYAFVVNVTAVPEPSSLALLALGGLMITRRRR